MKTIPLLVCMSVFCTQAFATNEDTLPCGKPATVTQNGITLTVSSSSSVESKSARQSESRAAKAAPQPTAGLLTPPSGPDRPLTPEERVKKYERRLRKLREAEARRDAARLQREAVVLTPPERTDIPVPPPQHTAPSNEVAQSQRSLPLVPLQEEPEVDPLIYPQVLMTRRDGNSIVKIIAMSATETMRVVEPIETQEGDKN